MEDIILVISIIVVIGLGFIPVYFLCRFLNRIRKPVIDRSKKAPRRPTRRADFENDPAGEFEQTGEVYLMQK